MQMLRHVRWGQALRRLTPTRLLLLLLVTVPLFNEFLSYVIQPWTWPYINNPAHGESVRVLFVADAQIQGFQDESAVFGPITRWDSDRYLRRTFEAAFSHHQPDVVVFLGDLLDEGSKATNKEYAGYYERFKDIFRTSDNTQIVYLSGDNDVGGEGFDAKEEWKVQRFDKYFNQPGTTTFKFVDFMRLHWNFGEEYVGNQKKEVENLNSQAKSDIRILLNHMSILERNKDEFQKMVKDTKTSIIFTGHTHTATLYTCIDCYESGHSGGNRWRGGIRPMEDSSSYAFKLNDGVTLHEVVVPSCSYRMGVPRMGFGAAVIGSDNELSYTVLWLPSRYNQLYSYLCFLLAVLLFAILRAAILIWYASKDKLVR